MSREIKFRAWVYGSGQKRMIQWKDIDAIEWCNDKLWYKNGKYTLLGNLTLLQFTGITDKNRKEIYEGDIVIANGMESVLVYDFSEARKFVNSTIQDTRKWEQRRSNYIVYWQDNFAQFNFKPVMPGHSIATDISKREYEIIGNIYENPELVK
jgi:uncharacterized phage protein (TIGR01671 family)